MKTLTDGNKSLVLNKSKPGKSVNIFLGLALSTAVLVDDLYIKMAAITLLFILSLIGGSIHHKSLLNLGINPTYVTKLKIITVLSLASIILFGVSVVISFVYA